MGDPTPERPEDERPEIERIRDGSSRWYVHKTRVDADGNPLRYISVTSALEGVAKHALVPWAGMGTAALAMSELPRLVQAARIPGCEGTDSLTRCGRCYDCTVRWLGDWAKRKSEESKLRGQKTHQAIDYWVRTGTWPEVDEEIRPYIESYQRFVEDHGIRLDDYELAEAIVLCDEHMYAGTLDHILRIHASRTPAAAELVARITGWPHGSIRTLTDVKTREAIDDPRFFQDMALQLVAYDRCPVWVDRNDWTERPKVNTDGGFICQVRPDGYATRVAVVDDDTWRAFLDYCRGYRWTIHSGARSVGANSFPLPDEMQGTQAGHTRAMVARGIPERVAKKAAAVWARGDQEGIADALRLASPPPAAPAAGVSTPPAKKTTRKATKKAAAPSSMPTATAWGSMAGDQPATHQQVPLPPERPARPTMKAAPRIAGATLGSMAQQRRPGEALGDGDIPF